MRGRIAARTAAYELALYGAWQTERFAREDKLKQLSAYLPKPKRKSTEVRGARQSSAELLAAFLDRQQRGAPISIELVDRPRPRTSPPA